MNFQVVIDSLTKIVTDIIHFIPNLVNGLIILMIGYLIARLVRWILGTALSKLKFDPLIERTGITGSLRGLGIKTPLSWVLAQTVFTFLLLSFLITSTRLMGLEAVAQLLERLLGFLPNIIAAVIIFLLGGVAAQFVGNLISNVGAVGGLTYAARVGRVVQYIISLFVVVLALGQLGVDTAILVTAITIAIAAFGLALGLALGLGARGLVYNVLAGYYIRQRFTTGRPVALADVSGEISTVGSVNTVLRTRDGEVVVPNSTLLEATVRSPRPPSDIVNSSSGARNIRSPSPHTPLPRARRTLVAHRFPLAAFHSQCSTTRYLTPHRPGCCGFFLIGEHFSEVFSY